MGERNARPWDLIACTLLVLVPFVSHLQYHGVPFGSTDTLLLLVPVAAFGAAIGVAAGRSGPLVRVAILSLLTIAFADLQFDVTGWRRVVLLLIPAAVWILREHVSSIATVFLGAFLLALPLRATPAGANWVRPAAAITPGKAALPPILYLVLDEHSAARAFPDDVPEAVEARDRMIAFYRDHGFRRYEYAYSRHLWTVQSMAATLSGREPSQVRNVVRQVDTRQYTLLENRVFRWAAGQGYRIQVTQSDYLNYCSALPTLVGSCETYRANTAASLGHRATGTLQRAWLSYAYFAFAESEILRSLQSRYRQARLEHLEATDSGTSLAGWQANKAHSGLVVTELERLRQSLRGDLRGNFIFAHLLLPHSPYELDRTCRERGALSERLAMGWMEGMEGNTAASERVRWKLYAEQMLCLYTQLDSVLGIIDSATSGTGAIVLIHGDHGSRIGRSLPAPRSASTFVAEDVVAGFGTLLAIRGPAIAPGVDSALISVQDFVGSTLTGVVHVPANGSPSMPTVALQDYGLRARPIVTYFAPVLARAVPAQAGGGLGPAIAAAPPR